MLTLRILEGLDFFITEIPDEVFTYSEVDPMQFSEARAAIYPYLLVNIGSGVSMIKVSGPQQFERIGGSSVCPPPPPRLRTLTSNRDTYSNIAWRWNPVGSLVTAHRGPVF